MDYTNKTVLLTSTSNGTGYELSKILAKQGAKVYSFDGSSRGVSGVNYLSPFNLGADVCPYTPKDVQNGIQKINGTIDVLVLSCLSDSDKKISESEKHNPNLNLKRNIVAPFNVFRNSQYKLSKDATIVMINGVEGLNLPVEKGAYAVACQTRSAIAHMIERAHPNLRVRIAYTPPKEVMHSTNGSPRYKERKPLTHEIVAFEVMKLIDGNVRDLIFSSGKDWHFFTADLMSSTGYTDPSLSSKGHHPQLAEGKLHRM